MASFVLHVDAGTMATDTHIERAFLFADLSGYTALTEAHGDAAAADIVERFVEIAASALRGDAAILERVGDELVVVAADANALVETAVALRDAVGREPLFPVLRAGIHRGHVVERGGRFFGGALNIAARIATLAGPGQIVCTEAVICDAEPPGVRYRAMGPVRLRNVTERVPLFEVLAQRAPDVAQVDPVCRLHVVAEDAVATVTAAARTYVFCSAGCAAAFTARPEDYLSCDSPDPFQRELRADAPQA